MSEGAAQVTAIVVSFNTLEDTLRCVESLSAHGGGRLHIVVVDNASADGTPETIGKRFPDVVLHSLDRNCGFGAANNVAIKRASSPLLLLLNSDARLGPGAVEALVARLESEPDLAIVGPRTLNEDGSPQLSWGRDLTLSAEWRQRRLQRALDAGRSWAIRRMQEESERSTDRDWVSGSCFAARTEALQAVGGFDEGFFLFEEDVDLCRRVRLQGWRVAFEPSALVIHRRGRSMRQAAGTAVKAYHASHLRYYAKHRPALEQLVLRVWMLVRASTECLGAVLRSDGERARSWLAVAGMAIARGAR